MQKAFANNFVIQKIRLLDVIAKLSKEIFAMLKKTLSN